jgi:hypothetical protein
VFAKCPKEGGSPDQTPEGVLHRGRWTLREHNRIPGQPFGNKAEAAYRSLRYGKEYASECNSSKIL